MPARVQGLNFGLGSATQTNISTASPTFNKWRKLNMDVPFLVPNTETDKDEIGKGNEFISQVYKTSKEPGNVRIEKYGSAEFMNWAMAYALGNTNLTSGLYTSRPIDPGTTLELPYFTVVSQIAEGGGEAIDESEIGCAIESVEIDFHYSPARNSVKCNVEYMGSGVSTLPSGVSLPATITESYLSASSMAISINGVNYVSSKDILMGKIGWKNNLIGPLRYTPGSGLDSDGFAIGNRIFIGNRVPTLEFTVFAESTSTEYAQLVAQSTGVSTVTFGNPAGSAWITFTYPVTSFETRRVVQESGLVALTCSMAPHYDPTVVGGLPNGVLIVTGKCSITDINQP